MEYYYPGTESLWCGNWNHLVCRRRKCEVDHPSQSTVVNLGKKQKWCSLWFLNLKFSRIHLAQIIIEFWAVYGHYIIDVPVSEIEPRCCFFSVESKDCMKSASYEYRKMSARRGTQFVPIRMPTVCWKTFPAKTTKILSTRNSSILMMSPSEYLFFVLSAQIHKGQRRWKFYFTELENSLTPSTSTV